jgi:hypothetical protein
MAIHKDRHLRNVVQSYLAVVGSEVVVVKRLVKQGDYQLAIQHLDQMLNHTFNARNIVREFIGGGTAPSLVEAAVAVTDAQPAMTLAEEAEPAPATPEEPVEVPPSYLGALEDKRHAR